MFTWFDTIDGAYGDSSVVLKVIGNFSFVKRNT